MDAMVQASVGSATHQLYAAKWKAWTKFMSKKGMGPWLHLLDAAVVINTLLEFMACRLFAFDNQLSTVRGYLAAIKFFHKLHLGWEVPTSHCLIVAAGKGIARIRGGVGKKAQVRLPLTWSMLAQGYLTVSEFKEGGRVMWLGLALTYFLLCRASELFAYADGLVHPEFCLTRNSLTFYRGTERVGIEDRALADSVQVDFIASKGDQNREGRSITRGRSPLGPDGEVPVGAFEAVVAILDVHPELPGNAPLLTRQTPSGWRVITRTEGVAALRVMVESIGLNPAHFALHSGRIGAATQMAAQGLSALQIQHAGRWKSQAFMVYVRDTGAEGAKEVSRALEQKGEGKD